MDYNQYNQNNNNYYQQSTPPRQKEGLAIASMVCGIISLVICCIGLSLPFGALGILFATLAHRKGQPHSAMALTGLITSWIGLIMGLILGIMGLFITESPSFQRGMYDSLSEVYGENYAEELMEIYGFEID